MFITSETDLPLFNLRLREAIAWCAHNSNVENPAGSLRNKNLKPLLLEEEEENLCRWNYDVLDPVLEVVRLCRKRAENLFGRSIADYGDGAAKAGRILMFYPHETLVDGAAWQSSNGYFDYWNIPPWDTWFWYRRVPGESDVLYSWVPGQFLKFAEVGVSVNPEECIKWLERDLFQLEDRKPI